MTSVIEINHLTMKYGQSLIQEKLNFNINKGDIFIIMGGSGCGKSTLLRHLIGLVTPYSGTICYAGEDFHRASYQRRNQMLQNFGVLYQSGALWSAMTLAENVALPLLEYTKLDKKTIQEIVSFKLALVGLAGFEHYMPAEISGGMKKRAALARAIALDPEILFFDEPSAGLDPISAYLLDALILEIRESLNATIVIVTHELASINAIGNNAVFLDANSKTMLEYGHPKAILKQTDHAVVRDFLTRGEIKKYS